MSYRKKHSGYGKYVPVAMLMMALTAQGCRNNPQSIIEKYTEQGLFSDKPKDARDKYGSSVKLTQVSIPLYNSDGSVKKDYAVLTWGQDAEFFSKYKIEDTSQRCVFLNNGPNAVNIMVGKYGEVLDQNGQWVGMIIDIQGNMVPIALKNVERYYKDCEDMLIGKSALHQSRNNSEKKVATEENNTVEQDTLSHDTNSVLENDTTEVMERTVILNIADTIANKRVND